MSYGMSRQPGYPPSDAAPAAAGQPETEAADLAVIRYLAERLVHYLSHQRGQRPPEEWRYLAEPGERQHRLVLLNPAALRAGGELTFVAFFGQKRPDADDQALAAMDAGLISDFAAHPNLLSYSSLQLPDGNWANLVLMQSADAIHSWAGNERHAYAARTIAPACYASIRIHRGRLPRGLRPQAPIEIRQTQRLQFGPALRGK